MNKQSWVDGVRVINDGGYCEDEVRRYIELAKEQAQDDIQMIRLTPYRDQVQVEYETVMKKFERIRRITGYLVGTTDRWNNAKRAEEHDRVKHDA